MKITASEFHATALPQPLRFAPPYADRSANPSGYAYWWQLIRLVFDLPDPRKFPPLTGFSNIGGASLQYVLRRVGRIISPQSRHQSERELESGRRRKPSSEDNRRIPSP
ncbi:hypothetical protein OH805_11075 [Streptomyces sp. NBC_00879]|uniref:hypothetical protein n=1 Tax=Streptomyces sp. NBC_00879 TaxID=2975855 RepID=UPI003870E672|nr:hypothetical protein OH805_11075 [Streptomyces sp. NBC_00879]